MRRNVVILALDERCGMGDAIMCTPLAQAIRRKYPGARSLLFFRFDKHGAVFARNPHLDAVIRLIPYSDIPDPLLVFQLHLLDLRLPPLQEREDLLLRLSLRHVRAKSGRSLSYLQ